MSLALDYRPECFDDMVGNETTIAAVSALLDRCRQDIPHTWLFTGPSGCGKTTMARILASELGCKGADFYEVDAAGENGIATVRAIREQMAYQPMEGSCRVWLLDECHMITGAGQEALLKALEDTPKHVYFMLATTEPNKLKTTLKNRCVQFEMAALGERQMQKFLDEIVKCEEKDVPSDVIKTIAANSMGSSRAALQLLDTVIDLPQKKMKAAAEKEAMKQNAVIDLCRALLAAKPWKQIADIIKGLDGEDPESIRRAVLGYCASVMLNSKDAPVVFLIMDAFREPFYNTGKPGLVIAAYEAMAGICEE